MNKYYPFELHCHTYHSDGEMSPKTLIMAAKERGYAGIAVTDHNTVSGVEETVKMGKQYGLNVIKGIEWTTFFGHITALGNNTAVDWREIDMQNIDKILEKAAKAGAVLTIAHPLRYGAPICKGCYMELPITKFEYISALEVWSQRMPNQAEYNLRAVELYDRLLKEGRRIAAVYGYDWHSQKDEGSYAFTFLGDAKNPLDSIKSGDTYISVGLGIDVIVDGKRPAFGSILNSGKHIFEIRVNEYFPKFCQKFGVKAKNVVIKGNACGEHLYPIGKDIELDCRAGYLRIEIQGEMDGKSNLTLALTSPYYIIERR